MKLTYLSHSSFLLDDGTHTVVIDPFLTGNPTAPLAVDSVKAQYVVLTHAHGDHLGDALDIAEKQNALIIAVNELANYASEKGVNAHNMHIGGAYNFPFGRVKFTIAHHGSSSPEGLYMGEPAGVVITMGGKTLYHCGDTGLFLDMQLIGERDHIDCMMAPIGDNFTMGIDDAVKAVEFVKPGLAIPIHYNTFPVIAADPQVFAKKVEAQGMQARVMEYGETLEL
ncbi:MAG: metal-dependent hydrolase [Ignavibacteria bacterium]|nr:MAG: metal-dependent hydrolase [Ignavibacteria bacterium]